MNGNNSSRVVEENRYCGSKSWRVVGVRGGGLFAGPPQSLYNRESTDMIQLK